VIGLALAAVALAECTELTLRGRDDAADSCYVDVINSSSDAVEIAGSYRGLGNVTAANDWYRRALDERPEDPTARVAWGDLFRAAHQDGDAEKLYREALDLDPGNPGARLKLATLYADRFDGAARAMLAELRAEDPQAVGPQLLEARLVFEVGQAGRALELLDGLLLKDDLGLDDRLSALSLRAAMATLTGEADNEWLDGVRAIDPGNADAYATAAHFFVITRRYREAVALLEQAVAVDPERWQAHSDLGLNLLRVDRLADARTHLESAYRGDPYDVVTVNTLRLLDMLDGYQTVRDARVVMRSAAAESGALAPHVQALASRAALEMAPRYGYALDRPMVVEIYQHHDDFAVRTAGLPGIGILGATFGDVVVMDGPSAKGIEEGFDWASALWHEMAHVVTLNATDNLVSRWFSEGVSELEEWRYGPSRRRSVPLSFLEAWQDGKLLPIAELDSGFIRPSYDGQIMVSYVQAGLVCQFVSERYPGGLTRMLAAYGRGLATAEAIREALGVMPEELDAAFAEHLESEHGALAGHLDEFRSLNGAARQAADAGEWAAAAVAAREAVAVYPGYVEQGGPYPLAVKASREAGDVNAARALARAYFQSGGRSPDVLEFLAAETDGAEALTVRESLALTVPLDLETRQALADGLLAAGDIDRAVREYRAVLSLAPHDRAGAHYRLAAALNAAGEREAARREVLLALEIAPRYSEALSLLIELQQ